MANSYLSLADALAERGISRPREHFARAFRKRMVQYFEQRETTLREETTAAVLRAYLEELNFRDIPVEDITYVLDAMYAVTEARWCLEEDTIPVLQELLHRGYSLGLISNAADARDVQRLIDRFQLGSYFSQSFVSAAVGVRKPHPRIFELALDALGVEPDQAVMVGDTLEADVLGANRMGIKSIWITRRVANPDKAPLTPEMAPDRIIHNLGELLNILE